MEMILNVFPGVGIGDQMQVGNSSKHKGTQGADEGDRGNLKQEFG